MTLSPLQQRLLLQNFPVIEKPEWLEVAAKRKYGRSIYVVGAFNNDIEHFENNVQLQALQIQARPQEVGRQVVDIDKKEHINKGDKPDTVKITSGKGKEESKCKNYQLNLGKTWAFTGNFGLNVGAQFFNVASAGTSLGASITREKTTHESFQEGKTETLSQDYGIAETLTVAPKSKMTAEITTYATTYEATTTVQVRMPASLSIPVRYRSALCHTLGINCTTIGQITPHDLFGTETDYRVEHGYVSFTLQSKLSYLGETAEFIKKEEPL